MYVLVCKTESGVKYHNILFLFSLLSKLCSVLVYDRGLHMPACPALGVGLCITVYVWWMPTVRGLKDEPSHPVCSVSGAQGNNSGPLWQPPGNPSCEHTFVHSTMSGKRSTLQTSRNADYTEAQMVFKYEGQNIFIVPYVMISTRLTLKW